MCRLSFILLVLVFAQHLIDIEANVVPNNDGDEEVHDKVVENIDVSPVVQLNSVWDERKCAEIGEPVRIISIFRRIYLH